eukprot:CAMPEP_0119310318 /NCGR_PEP_ID=MMETSP1333-20130426/18772_1 /TAXON_ID=418940 /ORGANISM="Scyphosphaera apsteinii, Strain RCC1455" /LENGTH=234 /DNA_ID=CAMNT_0007314481 /DNA_START=75 /DNA_END=778 /DNA_ORIENTATION=-
MDDDEDEDVFHGVMPLTGSRNSPKRRKTLPESSAFFYSSRASHSAQTSTPGCSRNSRSFLEDAPTPEEKEAQTSTPGCSRNSLSFLEDAPTPEEEEALMVAMGLPTQLRAYTAEVNNDAYQVWASDPSNRLSSCGVASAPSSSGTTVRSISDDVPPTRPSSATNSDDAAQRIEICQTVAVRNDGTEKVLQMAKLRKTKALARESVANRNAKMVSYWDPEWLITPALIIPFLNTL